ncbi:response regulator [Phenylobacterium sp.]|uniref:response regulator n=1 Tax=Phenylobacterium sp. TaxID=1871053 RepID=UPI0035C7E2AC
MTPHSEDFARTDGAEGPLRVLVADDDLRSQRLLAALLDFAGACPVIASDGSEALEAWRQARWDLILMDVKMPFLDGLALTRIIRHAEKTEPRERTAILGVTACATWQDQKACLAAGMDAVISKPFSARQLFEAMEQLCGDVIRPGGPRGLVH